MNLRLCFRILLFTFFLPFWRAIVQYYFSPTGNILLVSSIHKTEGGRKNGNKKQKDISSKEFVTVIKQKNNKIDYKEI